MPILRERPRRYVTVSINQATGQVTLTPGGRVYRDHLAAGRGRAARRTRDAQSPHPAFYLTVAIPSSTTTPVAGADAPVDFSSAYNHAGITADGARFTGGLGGVGNASPPILG